MAKGKKYWVRTKDGEKKYFDDINEARWYVTRYMKGIAEIHSDNL